MKKTLKLTLLVCFALLSCALMFVACDSGNKAETNPPHEHTFGSWETVIAPTCKQEGTETRKCNGCNETQTRTTSKLSQHSTMQGICAYCGDFVGLLSDEWDTIRVALNDAASLNQQIGLQVKLYGTLNIDKCNDLYAKFEIVSSILSKYPSEFTDFSNHFSLIMDQWETMADKVNNATTQNARASAWQTFSTYFLAWQNEYFTIVSQYYPPK